MDDATLDTLLALACQAASAAADIIVRRRGNHGAVLTKDGATSLAGSVVTEVDRDAQTAIINVIQPSCDVYGLGLLAEEDHDDGSRLCSEAFWCIDPLDGTLAFIEGRPGFAVSVALVSRDGTPLLGACVDPLTGVCYSARRGAGAQRDGHPFTLGSGDGALHFFTDRSFTLHPGYPGAVAGLGSLASELGFSGLQVDTSGGGVMFAMWAVERGHGCYFKYPKQATGGGSSWDYAATSCIYRELDLPVGDIAGRPLPLNNPNTTFMNHCGVCYATRADIADAVYGMAKQYLSEG